MKTLDEAYEAFQILHNEISSDQGNIITEEDAKLKIITRILTECLSWQFPDIGTERKHDNGFSDYLISTNTQNCLIVEAKRIGHVLVNVTDKAVQKNLKLNGPGLKSCDEGISQAASYAQPLGAPVAILTDGEAWVIFKTSTPGENYKEKQAFVFPSLQAVSAKFSMFYDLISKNAFATKTYNQLFDELHHSRALLTSPLVAPISSFQNIRLQRSQLAFALEPVFDNFFSRMTGEDDADLILECFVETKESRIADHSLEKMTARVLGNIDSQSSDVSTQLSKYISNAIELEAGESVFIVGPTGSGKSTFIDRFFKKTLEDEARSKCFPVRLNFLEASGNESAAILWATNNLIQQYENLLYKNGNPSWDELRGLYFSEYKQMSTGFYAKLYQNDKDKFYEKFSDFMASQIQDNREDYLHKLLYHVIYSLKKLPILIVDNSDEFPADFKERVFQFAQSIRVKVKHCIVMFPITDKSAWSFTKTDIYGIYQSKSFFLPTPPPREIFRKRISYLKEMLIQNDSDLNKTNYFSGRGIKISIPDLSNFATVIEDSFVNDEYSSRILGELSNYNIRRTLRLARRIITSPVFKIDDLVMAYASGAPTYLKQSKFLNALLKGDYKFFNKKDTDATEIIPIFQIEKKIRQSPLLKLRILSLLEATHNTASNVDDRHLPYENLSQYFQSLSCSESAIDEATKSLMSSNLIEPFDPSTTGLEGGQKLAINFSGRLHCRLARSNKIYFEQMALTTEIIDTDIASTIFSTYESSANRELKLAKVRTIFANYLIEKDNLELSTPKARPQYECQNELLTDIKSFITIEQEETSDRFDLVDNTDSKTAPIHHAVLATVDFFNFSKAFGFVDVPELGERYYINLETVRKSRLTTLNDGDDILCDIGPSAKGKGSEVTLIHDLQTIPDEIQIVQCEIVRLVSERLFGFVSVFGNNDDALFHFSLLPEEDWGKFKIGTKFNAEVRTKRGLLQVRKIDCFI